MRWGVVRSGCTCPPEPLRRRTHTGEVTPFGVPTTPTLPSARERASPRYNLLHRQSDDTRTRVPKRKRLIRVVRSSYAADGFGSTSIDDVYNRVELRLVAATAMSSLPGGGWGWEQGGRSRDATSAEGFRGPRLPPPLSASSTHRCQRRRLTADSDVFVLAAAHGGDRGAEISG